MRAPFRFILAAAVAMSLLSANTASAYPRRPPPHPRPAYGAPGPGVVIALNPWAFGYVPAPRPGWIWVAGHYDARHVWFPGYWQPASPRAGWAWVPGFWDGPIYVEGRWREDSRPGWGWVEGYYDNGRWVEGHWEAIGPGPEGPPDVAPPAAAPSSSAPPPPPPADPTEGAGDVHHDY